jgi:16S rRNA (cytidine1402-2'-O)-methyltransferase
MSHLDSSHHGACYPPAVPGTLYVIATPLGNLDDLSPRARDTLRQVGCIACEDTRRTARLLSRFSVETPTISCHKFNEAGRLEPVLRRLHAGEDIALVSDGGTPAISDPGARLVEAALAEGITVCPVPGPSAPAALLSASGLPADRFVFDGFLPHRAGERRKRLRELAPESRTVVVLESPHRIKETLADIGDLLGGRTLVLGRELTKLHETIVRGSAEELIDRLGDGEVRGEITLAIAGADEPAEEGGLSEGEAKIRDTWRTELARSQGDRRQALRSTARSLGMKRAELYRRLAELEEIRD